MDIFQMLSIFFITLFYVSYFVKQLLLKKQGIGTNQLAKGNKPKRTFLVELFLLISTYAMAIIQYTSIFLKLNYFVSPIAFKVLGVSLLFLSVFFFIYAITVMRDSWRAGIDKTQDTKIITDGIYRISRNPAFVGFDLLYIGTVLIYPNIITIIGAITTIVLLHFQILEEEKYLPTIFGEDYIKYKEKTARYLLF